MSDVRDESRNSVDEVDCVGVPRLLEDVKFPLTKRLRARQIRRCPASCRCQLLGPAIAVVHPPRTDIPTPAGVLQEVGGHVVGADLPVVPEAVVRQEVLALGVQGGDLGGGEDVRVEPHVGQGPIEVVGGGRAVTQEVQSEAGIAVAGACWGAVLRDRPGDAVDVDDGVAAGSRPVRVVGDCDVRPFAKGEPVRRGLPVAVDPRPRQSELDVPEAGADRVLGDDEPDVALAECTTVATLSGTSALHPEGGGSTPVPDVLHRCEVGDLHAMVEVAVALDGMTERPFRGQGVGPSADHDSVVIIAGKVSKFARLDLTGPMPDEVVQGVHRLRRQGSRRSLGHRRLPAFLLVQLGHLGRGQLNIPDGEVARQRTVKPGVADIVEGPQSDEPCWVHVHDRRCGAARLRAIDEQHAVATGEVRGDDMKPDAWETSKRHDIHGHPLNVVMEDAKRGPPAGHHAEVVSSDPKDIVRGGGPGQPHPARDAALHGVDVGGRHKCRLRRRAPDEQRLAPDRVHPLRRAGERKVRAVGADVLDRPPMQRHTQDDVGGEGLLEWGGHTDNSRRPRRYK